MNYFVMRQVTLSCVCFLGTVSVWAQQTTTAGTDPGTLLRNLESLPVPAKLPEKSVASEVDDLSDLKPIDKLLRVEVRHFDALAPALKLYWQDSIGKKVSAQALAQFKIWAAEEAKEHGLYAFAQTDTEPGEGGDVLVVSLVVPRIKSVRVFVPDEDLAKRYEALLMARFSKDFAPGSVVDPNGLDQRLEAASFDLPVSLDIAIRSAGPNLVDLVVNVSALSSQLGQMRSGVVQVNNYGLKAYGRPQIMGMLSLGGFTPNALLSLTTQVSEGVSYGRAEYEAPVEAYAGRMKLFGSRSNSQTLLGGATASASVSQELGLGLTHVWGSYKSYLFKTITELGARQTVSRLSSNHSETGRVEESQLRMTWSLDNDRVARDPSRLSLTLTAGEYTRLGGSEAFNVETGGYGKLNLTGRLQRNISRDGFWYWVGRFNAQATSRNLDGYNRLALGGVNGVRAYTAADGSGDQGVVGTLELNRRFSARQTMGLFYDAGVVQPNKVHVNGGFNTIYRLQAVGAQWSGNVDHVYYSATLAKGVGGYKLAEAGQITESPRNPWRLSAALSYVF